MKSYHSQLHEKNLKIPKTLWVKKFSKLLVSTAALRRITDLNTIYPVGAYVKTCFFTVNPTQVK
jgi:hypothetical protein